MTACHGVELAILRQLDNELTRAERVALRDHLRACSACSALARRQRATQAAVRTLRRLPLPPALEPGGVRSPFGPD